MKIMKDNKDTVIKLLGQIDKLTEIDDVMYEIVPDGHDVVNKDEYIYYNWYKCQDVVFQLMANTSWKELNDNFQAPHTVGEKPKKPVAWYQTSFNYPDEFLQGPLDPSKKKSGVRFSGFIGDRMTDLVFHTKVSPKKRYNLLVKMLEDLKNIEEEFKSA